MARKGKPAGHYKVHQDCGVCQKPRRYRRKIREWEVKKIDREDVDDALSECRCDSRWTITPETCYTQ